MKRPTPPPSHAEQLAIPESEPPGERSGPAAAPPGDIPGKLPQARVVTPAGGLLPQLPDREQVYETLSGSFFLLSLKRAFRLQINPNEVLDTERKELAESASHITVPEHQAFLAWRRSVLLIVIVALVPLTVSRFIEAFEMPAGAKGDAVLGFQLIPAMAEGLLLLTALWQLFRWTQWQSQRRVLFVAWALYFIGPNLMYLFPFQSAYEDTTLKLLRQASSFGGLQVVSVSKKHALQAFGLAFGFKAMLVLAPKAISLMPGLIRASIVTKLQFPGSPAPGFLVLLAAPLYALFAYTIVLLPYQVTASPYLVVGLFGVMFAQIFIAMSGLKLIKPLTKAEANQRVNRYWMAYILLLVGSAALIVLGMYEFIRLLHFGVVWIGSTILSFIANVLLLTLIGADAIIVNLRRLAELRAEDSDREALRNDAERKLRQFCQ